MRNTTNNSFIQQLESKDAQTKYVYIFSGCVQLNSTDKTCQTINEQKTETLNNICFWFWTESYTRNPFYVFICFSEYPALV